MDSSRIVITGTGAVSSVGNSVPELWDSLLAGKSGIGPITRFDPAEYRTKIGGEVRDLDVTKFMDIKQTRRLDPFCHFAIAAADQAVAQAGLTFTDEVDERTGILVGSGIGGILTFQAQMERFCKGGPGRVSPFLIPMMISDMASGCLSIRYRCGGPNFGIVSACATGSHSIGEAYWMIKRGDADVMITGGAEGCISGVGIAGFCSMKALSASNDEPTRASRPFDKNRDGFVIAEGAGVLILESLEHAQARGAEILAEVIGYGASGDAYHITQPAKDGSGAARAIAACMKHAQLNPEDISYINAHGTSTPQNDKFETMAIKKVLGKTAYDIPISSTKSLTGHMLGAAGGIEAIICVEAIRNGKIPGTWNYETPDPDCDLDYVPNQTMEREVTAAMSTNFGFGGHNAALAFKKFSE